MRLFLVRHGESVDNVAGILAGSRDSPLTSHGVLQGQRLGAYLAGRRREIGAIRHIFASDSQRAYKTAEALIAAQDAAGPSQASRLGSGLAVTVTRLPELQERDFGSWEGKKYRSNAESDDGRARSPHREAESRGAMLARSERFLDQHLLPAVVSCCGPSAVEPVSVVVVAHGIILNELLPALLSRFSNKDLSKLGSSVTSSGDIAVHWSNTGFVEAEVSQRTTASESLQSAPGTVNAESLTGPPGELAKTQLLIRVLAVSCVDHLRGLKKTGGGIGSAQYDSKQKTVDSFFRPAAKNQKAEQTPPG